MYLIKQNNATLYLFYTSISHPKMTTGFRSKVGERWDLGCRFDSSVGCRVRLPLCEKIREVNVRWQEARGVEDLGTPHFHFLNKLR